jgi:tripartite-type tricarboxylate transporter receptor subunit TctC
VPQIIAFCSDFTSLVPGDVIATGTPEGVGHRRNPPLWMKPGDVLDFRHRHLAQPRGGREGIKTGATVMLAKIILLCVAVATAAGGASAQTYPTKPIRVVVGFAPGGPADVMARLIGQRIASILGHGFVIDNRPGAGGTIGARAVAESEPDGYTLLLGNTSTLVISPLIYKNLGYDAVRSFVPVASLGTTANLLIVHPALPVRSVAELVAFARGSPGKLNFSSAGIGTPPHLIGEMFKQRLGLDVVHVPYKGGGPSVAAVIAGETQFSFENPASSLPVAQAGNVRALASTGATRGAQTPDLPTMIEAGVPDFASVSFTGVVAPAGTPAAIVQRLNAAINESLRSPDVGGTLVRLNVEAQVASPEEFAAFLARERDKWSVVVRRSGVQAP